ncbi:hypothetical protein ACIQOW_03590 [Kitasatospora sp. NPDC091335]|uniref:hypothetical protein n=1 Tax=Kitasatospora sp. NPDC091335 TaxID=3364085 RepID=UPI0037F62FA2
MTLTAEAWNARYPIGTPVTAYPDIRPEYATQIGATDYPRLETRTRSVAWNLGHGTPVVAVDGYAGGISLEHIDPHTEDTPPTRPEPADLATALEEAHASSTTPVAAADPIVIDLANTCRLTDASTVYLAYMEDSDTWDGWGLYAILPDALQAAAADYADHEYGYQDEPDTPRPGVLAWLPNPHRKSWRLTDDGTDTGVVVDATPVRTFQEA